MVDLKNIKCPECSSAIRTSDDLLSIEDKILWVCPSCQTKVIVMGPNAGKVFKTPNSEKGRKSRDRGGADTYEIYYRDYKNKKAYFIATLPERRKNPEREKSLASIARWARLLFGGTIKDTNAIFVMRYTGGEDSKEPDQPAETRKRFEKGEAPSRTRKK